MSEWREHIKNYALKHNLSYGDAMKDSKCKEQYHKSKNKPKKALTKEQKPLKPSKQVVTKRKTKSDKMEVKKEVKPSTITDQFRGKLFVETV